MKILVIGGSGLIGSKLIKKLKALGHEAISAFPSSGVNTVTNEGLSDALKGIEVVVDVSNSPSFEDKAVMNFFEKSTSNLLKEEAAAHVKHHIALSVVGTELLAESGYFRAKITQEKLIKASSIPYTIVQATQFFEFLGAIADSGTQGQTIRLPLALFQPMAADDVATALVNVVKSGPLNNTIEIAGPERVRISDLIEQYLAAKKDSRQVTPDVEAPYYGIKLSGNELVPKKTPWMGSINFKDWFVNQ